MLPAKKLTAHAWLKLLMLPEAVADQWSFGKRLPVKGWPGEERCLKGTLGSTRLASSWTVGSRHPRRPPVLMLAQ
jgi:hypothetical protein